MSDASIETTLEAWASLLRDVKARIRLLFTQDAFGERQCQSRATLGLEDVSHREAPPDYKSMRTAYQTFAQSL
jgi:hypothetical protein